MYGRKPGKAHAFFFCSAPKAALEAELPRIRELARTPPLLELTLREDPTELLKDKALMPAVIMARQCGRNFFIEAELPGAGNKATADELANLLENARQPPLYPEGEQLRMEILYKVGSNYVFRE
ncbi:MAG: hypothetical protein AB1529_04575 [Candidatus Micrarchaeota archaeon]